jgi:hypothetical protein
MAITQFFRRSYFDPETMRVIGIALEMAREAPQLGDHGNPLMKESLKGLSSLQKPAKLIPTFCVSLC